MRIRIEVTDVELRDLILDKIQTTLGDVPIDLQKVHILVKPSKNSHRSEWEEGLFREAHEVTK